MSLLDGLGLQPRKIGFEKQGIGRLGECVESAGVGAIVASDRVREALVEATGERPTARAIDDQIVRLARSEVEALLRPAQRAGRAAARRFRLALAGDRVVAED